LRTTLRLLGIVFVALIVAQCAQIANPSGGPKDVTPPEVIGTAPLNGSAKFEGEKFTVYFDEFIELDNITQKAMISPPVDKLPDFKLKGKSLVVKFEDELLPNTTYSVYFGDAIVDITEKNPLLNYTYLFSTGETVDSMSITGTVVNAFDLTPAEEVFVLLYKDNNDTIPLDSMPVAVKPYYLSKTDENGNFSLNGLANEPYLIFAVKDLNNNYFYDQPGEEIAFLDSMIMPQHLSPPEMDSSLFDTLDFESPYFDSLQRVIDSVFKDSLAVFQRAIIQHELFLFDEPDTNMVLHKAETIKKNIFRFSFGKPAGEVEFHVLNYDSDTTWFLEEFSRDKDTIHWYLKQLPADTVELVLLYDGDTLGMEYMRTDPDRKAPGLERRRKKDKKEKIEYLGVVFNIRGSIRPDRQPELTFAHPIAQVLSDSILFVFGEDSTYNPSYLFLDSLHRTIRFPVEVPEEINYAITIPDSSFIDWNGLYNKKQSFRFASKSLREYGVLTLDMKPEIDQPYIVQLMTEKESIVRELYFKNDTTLNMLYLDPGTYKLKVIYDDNGNRKWDPGYYNMQLQPEKVIYFPKMVVIRGNWDMEEEWRLSE
jgi:hypothetical protein